MGGLRLWTAKLIIRTITNPSAPAASASTASPLGGDWPTALGILRDAGSRINQLGPDTSLAEALQLIAGTAVRLVGADPDDRASAVIYTFNSIEGQFDPRSRVSAGEGQAPPLGDVPRSRGHGRHSPGPPRARAVV